MQKKKPRDRSIRIYLPEKLRKGQAHKYISNEELTTLHEKSVWLDQSIMYIGSYENHEHEEVGVDFRLADEVIKNLLVLNKVGKPITIFLNNVGGYVSHGMAIYDAIKMSPVETTIIVKGNVMSMASVILQAADKRLMTPYAKMLVHYGSASYDGNYMDFSRFMKDWERDNEDISKIYAERTGLSMQELHEIQVHDTYLSATEAVGKGFADGIVQYPSKKDKKT